ncbi:MAG: hypothetical protein AABW59_00925 [archaeon]
MDKENSRQFNLFLDTEQDNKIFIKYSYSEDLCRVKEFVLIYFTRRYDEFVEVVKYDCSEKERLHVHYFWGNSKHKEYLDREISIDTMLFIMDKLVENWRKYLLKFNESKVFI